MQIDIRNIPKDKIDKVQEIIEKILEGEISYDFGVCKITNEKDELAGYYFEIY